VLYLLKKSCDFGHNVLSPMMNSSDFLCVNVSRICCGWFCILNIVPGTPRICFATLRTWRLIQPNKGANQHAPSTKLLCKKPRNNFLQMIAYHNTNPFINPAAIKLSSPILVLALVITLFKNHVFSAEKLDYAGSLIILLLRFQCITYCACFNIRCDL